MNLIFCNTLQKTEEENRALSGQVSIAEQHGIWHVVWNEDTQEGHSMQEQWYEGTMWKETLDAFRGGIQQKLEDGYIPLIEGMDVGKRVFNAGSYAQRLLYYSEGHANPELYEVLRQWRREQAAKEGKSAFIVASNRLLRLLSVFVPHTEEELQQIPGFGKQRIHLYGSTVLDCLSKFEQPEPFPLQWVREKLNMVEFQRWLWEESEKKHLAEEEKRHKKQQVLKSVAAGSSLSDMEEKFAMDRRELVAMLEELDRDGCNIEAVVEGELSSQKEEELTRIYQAFESLGDRYLKPVMMKLYSEEELKDKELAQIYEWLRLCRLKFRKQKS